MGQGEVEVGKWMLTKEKRPKEINRLGSARKMKARVGSVDSIYKRLDRFFEGVGVWVKRGRAPVTYKVRRGL